MAHTCYRHPGRETNVACSNCERPICPDCMISTPVGMRCPECAGGPRGSQKVVAALRSPTPYVTYGLIAVNVAVFLAEIAMGGSLTSGGGRLLRQAGLFGPDVANGDWYRIVTSGFLHYGILHLAFNMFALFVLGRVLEPAIGRLRLLGIYFVSLLAGALGALVVSPLALTAGASGAIFGLMGATFVIARRRGIDQLASQIGIWILINIAFTLGTPAISLGGHVGGLIAGALAGFVVSHGERQPGRSGIPIEIGGMSVLAAIAIAGALYTAANI